MGFFPANHYTSRMTDHTEQSPDSNNVATSALRRILRPLVKWLIANQITYPYLINMLKSIYVEVADKEFPVAGRKQTDSRINLLTGVHRKDVKRIRSESDPAVPAKSNTSIGAQLVARWMGDKSLHDEAGKPRLLPISSADNGETVSFDSLVSEIARHDIRPKVVLDELERLDVIEILDNNEVRLSTSAYTPNKDKDEKLFFFGKNIQDHIAASVHNVTDQTPPYFDRSVYYDQLSEESITLLNELCSKLGMDALIRVNEKALELQQRDQNQENTPKYRMNFGIFHFNTEYNRTVDEPDSESSKD